VVNVSEGRSEATLRALADAAGPALLDLHVDADHNRSVFTLAGPDLDQALRQLARKTVELIDLRGHQGAHPRLGALDLVPFVPLAGPYLASAGPAGADLASAGPDLAGADLDHALSARDCFAAWAAAELGLPCFFYGPERSLPDIRRSAFAQLAPDLGPSTPHPSAGALCVGARTALVAYNLWLADADMSQARRIAGAIRGEHLRALAMQMGDGQVQVSCNLVNPTELGPAQVYDAVAALAPVARAELVGLLPAAVLGAVPPHRWDQLDLDPGHTIEARMVKRLAG
jgi:glutamate formiminotransferase